MIELNVKERDVINMEKNNTSMEQNNLNHSKSSVQNSTDVSQKNDFKYCLLSSVWSQSRLISSLLNQMGLPYHRVFQPQALELYLLLINTELKVCYALENFTYSSLTKLNEDLFTIQSKVIASMDHFIVKSFDNSQQHKKNNSIISAILGKHHQWKESPQARFNQVICPILEDQLIIKPEH